MQTRGGMMMRIVVAGIAALAVLACGGGTGAVTCAEDADAPKHVLFIGNSLTYYNGVPYMLRALADSAGHPPPVVDDVALPDYGLPEHWIDGRAARAIRDGCWDHVVLQQGPSSQETSRALLLDYAARYAAIIRQEGGTPALLSVWPSAARRQDFPRAIESYALAAQAVDGTFFPAATAWLKAWERDADLPLYADELHPTVEGSYLAALVMMARLYGDAPAEMPAAFTVRVPGSGTTTVRIDAATAATLRQAAQAALDAHP